MNITKAKLVIPNPQGLKILENFRLDIGQILHLVYMELIFKCYHN